MSEISQLAAKAIGQVRASYLTDFDKAQAIEDPAKRKEIRLLFSRIIDELDRASELARTGVDPVAPADY